MVQVHLPSMLRPMAGEQTVLEVQGATLTAALDELRTRYPALERRLRDESGALRRYVNFYVDGEECRRLSGPDTPLTPHTELMIIPSVAGG
ncbi:MoaD/ThiS family protein [Amycolatopsis magusensis]|uniref:MoaD/ThiS family protein n=1 Tax=Amycolatopsis magusensis TaxID=882444 RepID=UPI0024A8253C|nr:MoaD/ThiS family protein [Amycolatopsis magusensis]MDI5981523.1 MoaD/ThiS family protein [Amycolatopsis magusensis]UJW34720.1 MoaD/ThiS family protein [Saccharothrix sp. AJ9571]